MRKLLLVSLMAVVGVGVACGGGDDGGTTSGGNNGTAPEGCYAPDASFDSTTPQVNFRADVLPILQRSCGLAAACHGEVSGPNPYLGPVSTTEATEADVQEIHKQNVGVASKANPGMNLIEPGDPMNSFLMHKLDDDLDNCSLLECVGAACGTEMPPGLKLQASERDTIRRWIAQGANVN